MDLNSTPTETATTPAAPVPPEQAKPPRKWLRILIWLAVAAILAAGVILLSQKRAPSDKAGSADPQTGQHGHGAGGPIPVSVAKVRKGDLGEYISAIGTVTSVYTVTVTSRVAGAITDIHYREGQTVHKGDLLAVIDPRPYQAVVLQAQGQLQRDQANLANSRLDLARYRTAFDKHAIPEQTVATQQASVNQNEGTVKVDQGNLDAAKVNVDYTQIRSPIEGRVGLRAVDPGNIVQANGTTPLLTITQLQPITVIFTMAEDYISRVIPQMQTGRKLSVEALDRDNQTKLAQGTVLTIDNLVDAATGTVKVRAIFPNRDYKLFPNEFVNAKLLVRTLKGVNLLPNAAVQRNNDQAFVYVLGADKSVKARNIKIAVTEGERSAATGVNAGESVVTDGFDKLSDGTHVTVRSPESPAAGQESGGNNEAQSK